MPFDDAPKKEHDEVISLLDLDARGIGSLAQEMHLLHKGFTTGKEVPLVAIARRFGLPEDETKNILSSVEEISKDDHLLRENGVT